MATVTFRHAELAAELTAAIASGRYPVGGRFPTEQELQEQFGVGRHTVREALKAMTEQGLLGRRRKAGTTVLSNRPASPYVHSLRDIHSLLDFAQDTVLSVDHTGFLMPTRIPGEADPGDGRFLRIAGVRSRLSDGKPLCWTEILIPERYAPPRDKIGQGSGPIYELVMKHHGLRLEFVEQEVSATELPRRVADKLEAGSQMAALLVRRRYFTPMGELFEITNNLYPADRFSVRTTVRQRV